MIRLLISLAIAFITICSQPARANIGNPPLAKTGAPGEGTCAECHTGTAGRGGVVLALSSFTYTPGGATMQVQVHVNSTNFAATGFQITARQVSNEMLPGGRFATVPSANTPNYRITTQNGVEYVYHTVLSGTTVFTFGWTPPATNIGAIRFYLVGVCGDHTNGKPDGNFYSSTFTMQPASRDLPPGYRWLPLNFPGLGAATVTNVSNDGRTTGFYTTATGAIAGFVRSAAGAVTPFTVPQAINVYPTSINSSGRIAGYFDDTSNVRRGFIREPDGSIAPFNVPGATAVYLNAINDNGAVAGYYINSGVSTPIQFTNPNAFTPINPDGFQTITSLSNNGTLGGQFHAATVVRSADGLVGFGNCIYSNNEGVISVSADDNLDITYGCTNVTGFGILSGRSMRAPNGRGAPVSASHMGGINNSGAFPILQGSQNYLLTPCNTTPTITSIRVPSAGGAFVIPTTSAFSDCVPNATQQLPSTFNSGGGYIGIPLSTPISTGYALLNAFPNGTAVERTSTAWVAGAIVTVTQDAATCAHFINVNQTSFSSFGGSSSITVTTPTGCPSTPTTDVDWIRFIPPFDFEVAPNNGTLPRTGTITIGYSRITITQAAGTTCSYSVTPTTLRPPPAGGTGNVLLSTGSACVWSALAPAAWISVTPIAGTGNATLRYTIGANTSTESRSATISVAGKTVTFTQAAAGGLPAPLRFVPMTPCRIADTRTDSGFSGGFGAPSLSANATRTFSIQSTCGLPSNAQAYSLNVTVVPKAPLAYITMWPAGSPRPLASTLNSWDGRIVANAAIIPAGQAGGISLFASDPTDIVIDINGYFIPPEGGGLQFYPLTPCRIADTTNTAFTGALGPPALPAATARTLPVRSVCGVLANAQACSLSVTAIPASGEAQPGVQFLSLYPSGQPRPLVSTLNAVSNTPFSGAHTSNAAIVPAGASGSIDVYASDPAHLTVDINGYFAPPGGGLNFYPLNPCRVADTRSGPPVVSYGSSHIEFPILSSNCGAPLESRAYLFNLTQVPRSKYYTIYLVASGQPQPFSQIGGFVASGGQVTANASIVAAGTGGYIFTSTSISGASDIVIDLYGYFAQ
ncbi:MAG: hypothetical protein HY820_05320 [Acidobacteria bacterium]|nr:hypothetical protein [Acidobacteriota bacterium]